MSSFAAASVAQLATAARRCRSRTPDEPTARERLASLAKPPGSLGALEDWAVVLCAARGLFKSRRRAYVYSRLGGHVHEYRIRGPPHLWQS